MLVQWKDRKGCKHYYRRKEYVDMILLDEYVDRAMAYGSIVGFETDVESREFNAQYGEFLA